MPATTLIPPLVATFLLLAVSPALADCLPGYYPGHDARGNRACISSDTRQAVVAPPQADHCAPGYTRTLDTMGRFQCLDKRTGVNASPQRADCPPGTWLQPDAFGNRRCVSVR